MKRSHRTLAPSLIIMSTLFFVGCGSTTAQTDASNVADNSNSTTAQTQPHNLNAIHLISPETWAALSEEQKRTAIDTAAARAESLFKRVRVDFGLWSQTLEAQSQSMGLSKAQRDARFSRITLAITGAEGDTLDLTTDEGRNTALENISKLPSADRELAQNGLIIFRMGQSRAAANAAIERAREWGQQNDGARYAEAHRATAYLLAAESAEHQVATSGSRASPR